MNKNDFVSNGIGLIEKDSAISDCFKRAKTDQERELMKKGLEQSLETAYNTYAKDYFESTKAGGYLSKILRAASVGAGTALSYAFFAFGGAGLALWGTGALLAKMAAECIDNRHYEKHVKKSGLEKIISKDGLLLAGESIGQLASSYIPGGELWAFLRGTKKYDNKIAVGALYKAKEEFLKHFGEVVKEEPKLVPLTVFRDPRYATNYAFSPA